MDFLNPWATGSSVAVVIRKGFTCSADSGCESPFRSGQCTHHRSGLAEEEVG